MVGVWEGLNLGSIPNDHMPSQKDPKISIERRCSTILPAWELYSQSSICSCESCWSMQLLLGLVLLVDHVSTFEWHIRTLCTITCWWSFVRCSSRRLQPQETSSVALAGLCNFDVNIVKSHSAGGTWPRGQIHYGTPQLLRWASAFQQVKLRCNRSNSHERCTELTWPKNWTHSGSRLQFCEKTEKECSNDVKRSAM